MFVAINNTEKNIFEIDEWINTTRDANGGIISPEFAMEILSKTNHFGHIKKVLKNIKEKCDTPEKMAPYREFILSCVDEREMSGEAMGMLREMAKLCGCEDELETINKKPKPYNKTDCKLITVKSKEEFEALRGENLKVYFDADEVNLRWFDLSKIGSIKFGEGAKVDLTRAEKLPKDLDFSMCSVVNLSECNLEGLNLKFGDGADVSFQEAKNLPKDLDVSMCSRVILYNCDLEGLKELKFREGAEVNFYGAKNLPKDLDVSMCSWVHLVGCDLGGLKELKFREGAVVDLGGAENLPKDLDVSMCLRVGLAYCNLEGVKELEFKERSFVNLYRAENLPKELDVSKCFEVDFRGCDLSGVKEIKFKNKKQEEEFMREAKHFSGKIVYVGEENKVNTMPVNGGMEM